MSDKPLTSKDCNSKKENLEHFLSCHLCSQKSIPIELSSYCVPYQLAQTEVFVCESCGSAFIINFLDNERLSKELLSPGVLYHASEIPF